MSAQVALLLRDDELVVVPQGGRGGRYFDIEPVRVVAPEPGAATQAVLAALADSAACPWERPPGPKPYRSPALKAVKARSHRAFTRNASFCWVFEVDGVLHHKGHDRVPARATGPAPRQPEIGVAGIKTSPGICIDACAPP